MQERDIPFDDRAIDAYPFHPKVIAVRIVQKTEENWGENKQIVNVGL